MGALAEFKSSFEKKDVPVVVNFASQALIKDRQTVDPASNLNADQRAIMRERLEFCQSVWKLTITGISQDNAVNQVAIEAITVGKFPKLCKRGHGGNHTMTVFNYRGWLKKLGKKRGKPDWDNAIALADRYSKNVRGVSGDPEFWKRFNDLYLSENNLSITASYDMASKSCRHEGFSVPSERQVRYWLSTHANQVEILSARNGKIWFANNIQSYVHRDPSSLRINECWFGDHHVFDTFVKVFDQKKQEYRAARPWLTAWMDAKSLTIIGVMIRVEDPNSEAILIALINGIRSAGNVVPENLYTDRGKDFLKIGLGRPFIPKGTQYEHSVCKELGIDVRKAKAYNAKAKTVERIFKEVCERFSKLWAAYLGNRPDSRPEIAGLFQKNPEQLPSVHQFTEAFMRWLDEDYHVRKQNGKMLPGISPLDAWNTRPDSRTWSDSELWLASLLPYTKTPTVYRGGSVQIENKEYRADELFRLQRKKIMVKFDIAGNSGLHAFDLSGKYIAPLKEINTIPFFAKTKEQRDALAEEMRRIRIEEKMVFGAIEKMTGHARRISPQDLLSISPSTDLKLIKVAEKNSVKGSNHTAAIYATEEKSLSRGEEKKLRLEEFDQLQEENRESEKGPDPATLAEFHKFHSNKKPERNDNDADGEYWSGNW